jgi:nucleoside-diphosphate-sugar epimerase
MQRELKLKTNKTILITGGTGFVGSHLAAKFIQLGYKICFLTRSNVKFHAEERILRALSPLIPITKDDYKVIDCDLNSPINITLQEPISGIVHAAASLSFKEEDRIETFATNVIGTKHLLEFATHNGIKRIDHISTRYIAGKRVGVIGENELNLGQGFFNPYEESKMIAEQCVQKWSADTGGSIAIYRPSVVVGNSKTGFTTSFSGYYTCARGFFLLKKLIESEFRKGSDRYNNTGIFIKGAFLYLPVFFPGLEETPIDILPIDVVVNAISDIATSGASGVFHITNSDLILLKEFMEMSLRTLGIGGVRVRLQGNEKNPILQRFNEQINDTVRYYQPYASYGGVNAPICDQTNTASVLGKPIAFKITKKFLDLILNYAMRVHFKG